MKKIKLVAAALLLSVSAGIAAPAVGAEAVAPGDCIYAEYRNESGACYGATTRLCQGPSDCPT